MLAQQEYCGDVINFKTYSKSFKNKARIPNPEENWAIFKGVHESIIDRETFELVQELVGKTKRRSTKEKNGEKNMFSDLLYCADCGSKLWYHVKQDKELIHYFSCSNYRGDRGTCDKTHYLRADSIYQVVMLELRRLARFLEDDEEAFAEMLAQKTNAQMRTEERLLQDTLQKAIVRNEEVARLYERVYEDNVNGKVTDEWFMQLSHKYEVERMELKEKIRTTREALDNLSSIQRGQEQFVTAVRKFMEMKMITAPLLRELIDHIDVYHIEGRGKNRTQRIKIHYRFIGYIEIPQATFERNYIAGVRQGVEIEYIPNNASA